VHESAITHWDQVSCIDRPPSSSCFTVRVGWDLVTYLVCEYIIANFAQISVSFSHGVVWWVSRGGPVSRHNVDSARASNPCGSVWHASYYILLILLIFLKESLHVGFEGTEGWCIHMRIWWFWCNSFTFGKYHKTCGLWIVLPMLHDGHQMFLLRSSVNCPRWNKWDFEKAWSLSCWKIPSGDSSAKDSLTSKSVKTREI